MDKTTLYVLGLVGAGVAGLGTLGYFTGRQKWLSTSVHLANAAEADRLRQDLGHEVDDSTIASDRIDEDGQTRIVFFLGKNVLIATAPYSTNWTMRQVYSLCVLDRLCDASKHLTHPLVTDLSETEMRRSLQYHLLFHTIRDRVAPVSDA